MWNVVGKVPDVSKIVHAVVENNFRLLELFLKQGMDINIVDNGNRNLLYHACKHNRLRLVQWFIDHNISLDVPDYEFGRTPLMIAARDNSAPLVKLLLEAGADPHIQSRYGFTAAMHSLSCMSKSTLLLLAEGGPGGNRTLPFDGEKSFHLLMDAGTDINTLFPFKEKEKYTEFLTQVYYHSSFVLYVDRHIDQLTSENEALWKSLRLKTVFN